VADQRIGRVRGELSAAAAGLGTADAGARLAKLVETFDDLLKVTVSFA